MTDRVSRAKQAITYAQFDLQEVTLQSAHDDPVSTARTVMSQWSESSSDWDEEIVGAEYGMSTIRWTSKHNPEVSVIKRAQSGLGIETHIIIGSDMSANSLPNRPPHVRISVTRDKRVEYATTVKGPDEWTRQNFNANGQLSNTKDEAAIVVVDNGDPVEHHFYTDGKLTGRQMWRTLYDANGKEIDNTLLNWRKQKKATGGLGEQPPGYTAFR